MDNKRKCLCSAYALEREGVSVSGRRGCCARQATEGRRLHENQRRRKYLRENGWLVAREREQDERGCVWL